jgi:UDP-glucose 4-epimerase
MIINLCHLLKVRPVKRIVYFSSAEVYGDDIENMKINEDTLINPKTYYGLAKYASECLLKRVADSHSDTLLLILRPPTVYGPQDTSRGYGPAGFIWAVKNKQEITLWGDGEELRGFLFLDDLVKIVYHLTFSNYSGVLNVASGRSHSFKEVLDIISELVSFRLQVASRPRTKPKVNQGFCNDRLMKLLPDFSFTSLREGIKRTFDEETVANKFKAGVV